MTPEEMLRRSTHVFIGVVEKHEFPNRFLYQSSGKDAARWQIVRMRVRVELVLRGNEMKPVVDVYEVFPTGGVTGDWNSTHDGSRYLFPVRMAGGRYRVVRDFHRSIFPSTAGPHDRLPLDESYPLWERIALMNWWIVRSDDGARITFPYFDYNDPGHALSRWRVVKLLRGLVRHPSAGVRVPACRALLQLGGWGQDECWDKLREQDKSHLRDGGYTCCTAEDVAIAREKVELRDPRWMWDRYRDRDSRRLLTAMSNRKLRMEYCRLYALEYPGDNDNGCPAEEPPPETIVRETGDVPLTGPWPQN